MEAFNRYNDFTCSAQYEDQYFSYTHTNLLDQQPGHDNAIQSMEYSLDDFSFLPGQFDYIYDGTSTSSLPSTGAHSTASPPGQQQSRTSNRSHERMHSTNLMRNDSGSRNSDSEERDHLTPAQARRKAQNRAAQRAFRDRKERHVRELEAKVEHLSTTTATLQSDNERLKLMLQNTQTENRVLRASAGMPSLPSNLHNEHVDRTRMHRSTSDLPFHPHRTAGPTSAARGEQMSQGNVMTAGEAWELLQAHPMYLSGGLDVKEVSKRLKRKARLQGGEPVFLEEDVVGLIEEVGMGSSLA
ncbi:transcription factor bZIP like protein [Zymoseptoria brevis]|uniref:Transcription factor bZIP like protein n=1 Tax=Zymoseptoria brevis TaxID=1047168 RepID=A0A0F4GM62_9PEZI|nr:transcription factor bZIP like protein [Zymoseptoria brevis]